MKVDIQKITKHNIKEVLSLSVNSDQEIYIETTQQCLEDAQQCKHYQPVALYWNDELAGFAMYGLFPGEGRDGRVWLDRFLIDKSFQGRGIGKIMLSNLIEHLVKIYGCKQIYLSLYENNQGALYLYQKFGFQFNGELDINGERVMVKEV
ncbi:GNAT family N-acetyltransferase [Paenibacillus massiliensis]|uniref:GNAT family N-acetyltransferase n=1 Tax=Paenibacillus massiliensis TaxID=225917 RepID=UPI0003FFD536|nr:GNAT family N-acetyltransferase [Paenibacillus massiliensis]